MLVVAEETKERRRIRAIKRLRRDIQRAVLDLGLVKSDIANEEISELDNWRVEGPYSKHKQK